MKFNWLSITFILTITSTAFASNSEQALKALRQGKSNWASQFNNGESTASEEEEVVFNNSAQASIACSKDDQNSVPYTLFSTLLSQDIEVKQDATNSVLTLDGGMMISNCNSMLKYNFSHAQGEKPYLFQVAIRKPASCSGTTCSYKVDMANDPENPGIKTDSKEMQFEPTYYGFISCLEKSGVLKNGEIQASKVVADKFKYRADGLDISKEVLFYSKGPEGPKMGALFGEDSSRNGKSCGYYEKITQDGFSYTSIDDIKERNATDLYNKICKSGDYRLIDKHLSEFRELRKFYNILKKVRNKYILNEIELLAEKLEKKDYSELDAEKFRDTIEDFYKKVVTPLKAQIAYKVRELDKTTSSKRKKALSDEINNLTAELMEYNKEPFLTANDYEKMKDFARKAPLEKQAWRDAAIALYSANNTAYHYSRYNDKVRSNNSDFEEISITRANKLISSDIADERGELRNLGRLASDPDTSIAREYAGKADKVKSSQKYNIQNSQRYIQQEQRYAQEHCLNPRKYWINRQKCMNEVQQNIQYSQQQTARFNEGLNPTIEFFMQEAQRWAAIERVRNGGNAPNINLPAQQNQNIPGQFNFQVPNQWNNLNQMNLNNFHNRTDPVQMYAMRNNQVQQPGVYWNAALNANNNWNNQQYNWQVPNRAPSTVNPAYWGMTTNTVPPAMNYHVNGQYNTGVQTFQFNN